MSTRHRILAAAACLMGLLALVQWCILPLSSYYHGLQEDISSSRERLQSVLNLKQELQLARSKARGVGEDAGKQSGDFSLYSYLDRLAEQQGIKDRIVFMRPSTEQLSGGLKREVVRLRLGGAGMEELIPYLYQLEKGEAPVRVQEATIRSRRESGQGLQVDLRVFVLKG